MRADNSTGVKASPQGCVAHLTPLFPPYGRTRLRSLSGYRECRGRLIGACALAMLPTEISARQREILDFVVEGLTNSQIAKRLFLSESTIKQHLRAAYKLLGVKNYTEAAKLMRRSG